MGVCAVSLMIGAVQFAFGRDLSGSLRGTPEAAINRAAKGDRIASAARFAGATRTISLRPAGLVDTSVLISLPLPRQAIGSLFAPAAATRPRTTVGCEPMVSVLTEVAKRLQPGHCDT